MLRRSILALPLLTLALPARAQAPGASEFLKSIYELYLKSGFKGQNYTDGGRFFVEDLARAIDRDGRLARQRNEAPTLDGDPFVDAQDWQIANLDVRVSGTGDKATGVVSFSNFGKSKRVAIDLVKTPQGWRIRDIAGASGSLRALFKLPP